MIDGAPEIAATGVIPAGFWRRVAAWVIDGILVMVSFFIVGIYLWPDLVETTTLVSQVEGARLETVRYAPTMLGTAVLGIAFWAYVALQECGPAQATLGKRMLRLRSRGSTARASRCSRQASAAGRAGCRGFSGSSAFSMPSEALPPLPLVSLSPSPDANRGCTT